jgi:acetyl-CoA C-acetyltransferase
LRDAVICEPLRTPVGAFGGSLRDVSAAQLGTAVVRELTARTQVQTTLVDDCVFAQSYPNGEAPAIGRVVALDAGLPTSVPGLQIDRRCGSGLQALAYAAMCVQTGAADLVIAGGAESMSQAEYYTTEARWGARVVKSTGDPTSSNLEPLRRVDRRQP